MKKLDTRHIIFHVLAAIYFIWLPLLAVLVSLLAYQGFNAPASPELVAQLPILFINLIFGALLMFLLRTLSVNVKIVRFVRISYYTILAFSLFSLILTYFL